MVGENGSVKQVRAKFRCDCVEKWVGWGGNKFDKYLYNYRFSAVVDDSPENKSFFESTFSNGELKMMAVKGDLFEVGECYYLDIIQA